MVDASTARSIPVPSPVPPLHPSFFYNCPCLKGSQGLSPARYTAFIVSLLPSPLVPDCPTGWPGTYQNDVPAFIASIKMKKKVAFLGGLPWELLQMAARQPGCWGRWVVSGAQGVSRVGWGQGPQEFNA